MVGTDIFQTNLVNSCVEQVQRLPCVRAVIPQLQRLQWWRARQYQYLSHDEDVNDDSTASNDSVQAANAVFGRRMLQVSKVLMVAVTVDILLQFLWSVFSKTRKDGTPEIELGEGLLNDSFSSLLLYIGVLEVFICGACASTAARMYSRHKYVSTHPEEAPEKERTHFIKIELRKGHRVETQQLYGLLFCPSTDGLECLIVEGVRPGSLLDGWNQRTHREHRPTNVSDAHRSRDVGGALESAPHAPNQPSVDVFSAIVAVNDVFGNVGLMQLQLLKPWVTVWITNELVQDRRTFEEPSSANASSACAVGRTPSKEATQATFLGRIASGELDFTFDPSILVARHPRCACLGLEDEDPQLLLRWVIYGLVFGWVSLLPVILFVPHPERPRQCLIRQILLRPCMFVIPLWLIFWSVDFIQIAFCIRILEPFRYFVVCHMLLPSVIVWFLFKLQAVDEKLILEQRRARQQKAGDTVAVVVEDPLPILLKELISLNPVALLALGSCVSIPIVFSSCLTPLETDRGKFAQNYLLLIYAPCMFLQAALTTVLWQMPSSVVAQSEVSAALILPTLTIVCFCLFCSSRFGRKDMELVTDQRLERGQDALRCRLPPTPKARVLGILEYDDEHLANDLVDCTEALYRDYELVYTA